MSLGVWIGLVTAGLVALVVPVGLRPVLMKMQIFDLPNHRSSHAKPTLRGGGVGPLLGFIVGGTCVLSALPARSAVDFAVVMIAAITTSLVGLVEDVRGLPVSVRAGLQLIVGASVGTYFTAVSAIGWIWILFAALFFAASANFTNFMDGINGISGFHGLVAGTAFAALGAAAGLPWLVASGMITALVFSAFLPWNLSPPGIFLGDVGSYLLGGVLGGMAIAALAAGLHPVAVLAPTAIYWTDALTTLLRRARQGEPLSQPHRSHIYQRLTDLGMSHVRVAGTVALYTLATSIVATLTITSLLPSILGAVLVALIVFGYLLLPRLKGGHSCPARDMTTYRP